MYSMGPNDDFSRESTNLNRLATRPGEKCGLAVVKTAHTGQPDDSAAPLRAGAAVPLRLVQEEPVAAPTDQIPSPRAAMKRKAQQ